ncbi:hypothetical protein [Streptomyces sp.]|uniref:hypothetical protein n=1 Tax=Streptomyces sp. TaxID=1931 RepID=UPI00281117BC|nr:hypothetical protein [Streptomyces sp.]
MIRDITKRRLATLAAATVATAGIALTTAPGAAAFTVKNGYLETYEFGLYYNSNQAGCVFDIYDNEANFSGDNFKNVGGCAGAGQTTNDNTASYRSKDDVHTYYVYTDANYWGTRGSLPPMHVGNASDTFKNEISSAHN